jgi:DNA-binding LytR/AlgR family response regulator
MRILIVEDEMLAADRMISLVKEIIPESEIVANLQSISAVVKWFAKNPQPDLILMDIQLADGLSFEIFDQANVKAPVIFTTAFNEYALRAFKVNSIDYLLKPIDKDELRKALNKYHSIIKPSTTQSLGPDLIHQVMDMIRNPYKSRFVIRIGEHIKTLTINEISFFYVNEKSSFIRTVNGRDFDMDNSLDQLDNELNPKHFYRVSRKYLVSLQHINDIIAYSGSRLKVIMEGAKNDEIIVSREKVSDFKKWLEG